MFRGVNGCEFQQLFDTNDKCYQYLIELKWGKGYSCRKCGHTKYVKGRLWYYRRCRKCMYDESVTANTVFHGLKFPMYKAFHIAFRVSARKKGMSTVELAAEVGVQQKTAWLFKRKLQFAMNDDTKLAGNTQADETFIGGYAEGEENKGRTLRKKAAVYVAIEQLGGDTVGNINFEVLKDFKAATMEAALNKMIAPDTHIDTDKHRSYLKIGKSLPVTQTESNRGKAMPLIHKHIMLFKLWLRGIHHKCSKQHLSAYLTEYKFRFNRRNTTKSLFNSLLCRMLYNNPFPYPAIKASCESST